MTDKPETNEQQSIDAAKESANGSANGDQNWQQRAEQAERQRDEYLALLKQSQADYENAHQRYRRERELDQKYRGEKLALDLLPALDNLERALAAAKEAGDESPLCHGVALVRHQLMDALKKHGIEPIEALGKPFDPYLHQALATVEVADQPPDTVVQVAEPGYRIHDRVLRVAKVIVAARPPQGEPTAEQSK
jgi:molecular chaperone GrpE